MLIRRSLSCLVALAVALTLTPRGSAATPDPAERASSDLELFQAYSQFFFIKRDRDFSLEMTLRESFLAWLYAGINREVASRAKEDRAGTLSAITPPELAGLDEDSYAMPDSIEDAPLRIRYLAWEDYQRTEYNHKYLQARLIKDRLIKSSTPKQRKRMFKRDLESAFQIYSDNQFRDAILRFDELIEKYDYTDVTDIAFYRGEAYLGIQLYDQAQENFQFVLENSKEGWFRHRSLERLISLAGDHGMTDMVQEYWSQYQSEITDKDREEYWATAERTARYLLTGQEWQKARDIFDSIPDKSTNAQLARLRAADCSLAMLELDDAEARYENLLILEKGKESLPSEIEAEAILKLGYIDYLRGRFDSAFEMFERVKHKGDIGERAKISAIWSLYRLSAFQQVIDRSRKFIEENPKSQYQYEARSLIGFSEELMGRGDTALENYRVVMSALDDRQDFYDFNQELGAISDALGKLQQLEEQIFIGGERDFFPEYLEVRQKLVRLVEGVRFARAVKTTPFLREVIKEQHELYVLFQEQADLEEKVYETQDSKLLDKYQSAIGSLTDIGSELSLGVRYLMSQKSLIQREQDELYESQMSDTLRAKLESEWAATEEAMAMVSQSIESAKIGTKPETLVEIVAVETKLTGIQDRILKVRADLRKFGQESVNSNLDLWSDFAYQRYTFGGLNFDYLLSREERISELDEYIRQVGTMLQDRDAIRRDTLTLAANLEPASEPGAPPYFAPAVPLWGISMPTSPLSDETAEEPEEDVSSDTLGTSEADSADVDTTEGQPDIEPSEEDTTGSLQDTTGSESPTQDQQGQEEGSVTPPEEGSSSEPVPASEEPMTEPAGTEASPSEADTPENEEVPPDSLGGKENPPTEQVPQGGENPQNGPTVP